MLNPFIPATSEEILAQLNTDKCGFDTIGTADKFCGMESGKSVSDSKVLFARIDEAKMLSELEAELDAKRKAAEAEAAKEQAKLEAPEKMPEINFDAFMAVEMRCAKIIACEKVEKSKKLLKIQVDLGYEQRQVVSGIAKYYTPDQLIGKKVAMVTNLAPAKLCGIESFGMILASGEEDVRVLFLDGAVELGARIR
jgi:methionyl-tRNA synthetase